MSSYTVETCVLRVMVGTLHDEDSPLVRGIFIERPEDADGHLVLKDSHSFFECYDLEDDHAIGFASDDPSCPVYKARMDRGANILDVPIPDWATELLSRHPMIVSWLNEHDLQQQIEHMRMRIETQGKRTDHINGSMRTMLSRFEVGGGYPGGVDVMMSDFRACFRPEEVSPTVL